jgi:putative methyltransferase (TIGR04325 family)
MNNKNFIIWEGAYEKKPKDIETETNYFSTYTWLKKSTSKTKKYFFFKERNYFVDNHLDVFCSGFEKKINILDFGGGTGDIFFYLQNSINKSSIDIYEPQKKIRLVGEKIFKKYKNIKFLEDKTKINKLKKYDVIYLGSVLQYIFDLDDFLKFISKLNFTYLYLYDVMSDKNPNFYSKQLFYGKKMTVKFYNLKNLMSKFKEYNLKTIFISNIKRNLRNNIITPPMQNFKKKYRINFSKTIILKKMKFK